MAQRMLNQMKPNMINFKYRFHVGSQLVLGVACGVSVAMNGELIVEVCLHPDSRMLVLRFRAKGL
eukprot:6764263-Pyramimonas_sp.AAC.1